MIIEAGRTGPDPETRPAGLGRRRARAAPSLGIARSDRATTAEPVS